MKAVIVINHPQLALKKVFGLPVLIRTVKSLIESGIEKIAICIKDPRIIEASFVDYQIPKSFITVSKERIAASEDLLFVSGETHYDSDFLNWCLLNNKAGEINQYFSEVPNFWWQRLDNKPDDILLVEKNIYKSMRQKKEGLITNTFFKPISLRLTNLLSQTKISPNEISLFNIILSLLGSIFLVSTNQMARVFGAVLILAAVILDFSDGELAYLKFMKTRYGLWFDKLGNYISDIFITIGLFSGILLTTNNLLYWKSGWILVLIVCLNLLVSIYSQKLAFKKTQESNPKNLFEYLSVLIKRDVQSLMIFALVTMDFRESLFWILFAMMSVNFVGSVLNLVKNRK